MSIATTFHPQNKRLHGLAATIAVHLALVVLWQFSRGAAALDDGVARRIQWIDIAAPQHVDKPQPKPAPKPKPVAPVAPQRAQPSRIAPPLAPSAPDPVITEESLAAQPAPPAPASPSAYDMMQQARKDLGSIDKELRKEFPPSKIEAPPDSPHIRMQKGMEHAAEMAPPRWYEQAKVTELVVPGGNGKRRYRVITAQGTFCVTYESNHRLDGMDPFANAGKPKYTQCPPNEQAATKQKY